MRLRQLYRDLPWAKSLRIICRIYAILFYHVQDATHRTCEYMPTTLTIVDKKVHLDSGVRGKFAVAQQAAVKQLEYNAVQEASAALRWQLIHQLPCLTTKAPSTPANLRLRGKCNCNQNLLRPRLVDERTSLETKTVGIFRRIEPV